MAGIREIFGELKRKDVINVGDRVKIKTVDGETREGILRSASRLKIKINGDVEKKEIAVEDILEIKKTS